MLGHYVPISKEAAHEIWRRKILLFTWKDKAGNEEVRKRLNTHTRMDKLENTMRKKKSARHGVDMSNVWKMTL